jgi:hypothetical protein
VSAVAHPFGVVMSMPMLPALHMRTNELQNLWDRARKSANVILPVSALLCLSDFASLW